MGRLCKEKRKRKSVTKGHVTMSYPSTDRSCNKSSCRSDPADTANDTLSNYTSGKAVTVSWYQLRIISRSVYRLSTIYSRYTDESKGGGRPRWDRHDFFSCKSRFAVLFYNELSFRLSILYISILFPFRKRKEKKEKGGIAKIYSRDIFGSSMILWKKMILDVPLFFSLIIIAPKFWTLKSNTLRI